MHRDYWEQMAPSYDEEIFDVLENDRKNLIRKAIRKYAGKNGSVIDIGCAIGKWLPILSPLFKKVIALDISQKNLDIAKALHPDLRNVGYTRADMSGKKKLPLSDLAICINAILTPVRKDRRIFFKSLPNCLKKGGHLILTIPSLESWMLTSVVQQEYRIDASLFRNELKGKEAVRKWNNIRQGNADIDHVPHKHYLKEELQILLSEVGFDSIELHKIEYEWTTEFNRPPKWLKDPKPWDWMAIARKS